MSGIGISVRGVPEVQKALDRLGGAPMKGTLQKASTAGAKALKPYVRAEAPRGATGRLRKSVSARKAKRDLPAAVVGHKRAFYWGFVVEGTKAHRIRFPNQRAAGVPKSQGNIQHPGAKANPFVARGFAKGERAALAAIDKVIDDYLATL